jgi:hypothetical protein
LWRCFGREGREVLTVTVSKPQEAQEYCPFHKSEQELRECQYGSDECAKSEECKKGYRLPGKEELENKLVWLKLKGKSLPALDQVTAEIGDPLDYGSHAELHLALVNFEKRHTVLAHECEYHSNAGFTQATYLLKHFNQSTFQIFYGPMGNGKTRALEILWHIAFRAIPANRVTRSALPRILDGVNATLLLDEVEFLTQRNFGKEDGLWAVLNSMHRRGSASVVCEEKTVVDERGQKVREQVPTARTCFGFVAMASRRDIFDATADRCIEYVLPRARPPNRKIDLEEAAILRRKLAQFAINVETGKEVLATPPEILRTIQPPRLEDIFEPIYIATPAEFHSQITEKLMMEVDTRSERLRNSFEHEMLEIIKNVIFDVNGAEIPNNTQLLIQPDNRKIIPSSLILDKLNESRQAERLISGRTAGSVLHKLGIQPVRGIGENGRKVRGYLYDNVLFSRLFAEYMVLDQARPIVDQIGPDTCQGVLFDRLDTDPKTLLVQSGPKPNKLADYAEDHF